MTYLDTSVFLAYLMAEDRSPPPTFWDLDLVSSRLLEYEVWTRLHAKRMAGSYAEAARALLGRIGILEMAPAVLARALDPFPLPVRTLDALHLASAHFLRDRDPSTVIATYDGLLARAGRALGFTIIEP